MKIEISMHDNKINHLIDQVEKLVEESEPEDEPTIECGFVFLHLVGDLLHCWLPDYF